MRRNALCLSVALFLTLAISGCATFNKLIGKKPQSPVPSALGAADLYIPSTGIQPRTTPEFPPYMTRAETQTSMPRIVAADPTSGVALQTRTNSHSRMHTVARKETLYSLARQYYGDHHRWKEIYEANRSRLRNPNQIFVGQRLAIP